MPGERLAVDGGPRACTRRLPLGRGVDLLGDEEISAVVAVLRDRSLFRYHSPRTPSRVAAFEDAVCDAFGSRFALATSSGTAALRCALAALGVGCGHEVVVPAFTFVATVSAVVACGAAPVFAEVDDTLTLDPDDVAAKLTPRTAAVVAVHLENVVCDMDALAAVTGPAGVPIVEDAAQAIGATYHGRYAGTMGALGACSLQQTKTVTTGEGGLVLTDDEESYVRAARHHDQGGQFVTQYRGRRGPERGEPFVGDNLRMTEIAGAIGLVQLGRLPGIIDAMRANATRIAAAVGPLAGLTPRRVPDPTGAGGSSLTWFAADAATARRCVEALRAEGVPAAQMYEGEPVYANPGIAARRTSSSRGGPWHCAEHPPPQFVACPRTEDLAARSVTVGVGPAFSADDCDAVAAAVRKVAHHLAGGR